MLILQFIITVLIADFVTGLLHWLEDAYGHESFPITGRLFTKPNILHHHDPRYFTRNSWWQSSWDLLCMGLIILAVAACCGLLTWHVWLFVILGVNANEMHKWAHRTPRENGRLITLLHRLRLIQGPRHHARHHTDPKDSHYCTLTELLNPLLDGIHFWSGLEWLIRVTLGIRRRVDKSVASHHAQSNVDDSVPAI